MPNEPVNAPRCSRPERAILARRHGDRVTPIWISGPVADAPDGSVVGGEDAGEQARGAEDRCVARGGRRRATS